MVTADPLDPFLPMDQIIFLLLPAKYKKISKEIGKKGKRVENE
jgi:hypothetical protein